MNKPLRVVARVVALPEKIEQVKAVLSKLVEPTRAEEGCLQYDLLQNQEEPTDFTFVEEWATEAALDAHLASKHIQVAENQLDGLIAAEPEIGRYYQIV